MTDPLSTTPQQPASRAPLAQRAVAAVLGLLSAAAGVAAVFRTDNELGTAALLLVAGLFLVTATFGLVPSRFRIGDNEMTVVGSAALRTLERIVADADAPTQENAIDTLDEELSVRGVRRPSDEAVASMLDRFSRYSDSEAPYEVHAALLQAGWTPSTPPRSTYIRWSYKGARQAVSLFQNSARLEVGSKPLVEVVRHLPTAEYRLPKGDVAFNYSSDARPALEAAETIRRFADGE